MVSGVSVQVSGKVDAIAIKNRAAAIQEDEEIEEEQPESLVDWKIIWKPLGIIAGVFLVFFFLNPE
jgi:hypothetical protein